MQAHAVTPSHSTGDTPCAASLRALANNSYELIVYKRGELIYYKCRNSQTGHYAKGPKGIDGVVHDRAGGNQGVHGVVVPIPKRASNRVACAGLAQ